MTRLNEFEALLAELQALEGIQAKERFTELFGRGCDLLEFDDEDAARVFDTSRPNANRWRRGKVVPPAAALVLKFLREEVEAKCKKLRRIAASRNAEPAASFAASKAP